MGLQIQTDKMVMANRSDITVLDKKAVVIYVDIPNEATLSMILRRSRNTKR